jgi:hypothetical protein
VTTSGQDEQIAYPPDLAGNYGDTN